MTTENERLRDRESDTTDDGQGSAILPQESPQDGLKPETSYESKTVMIRAERGDTIEITDVVRRFDDAALPAQLTVVERTDTFYGPELLLEGAENNWRLTAPGPDMQLLLWREQTTDAGYRERWTHAAEVTAEIGDIPQYDICKQCGNPIRSAEHERLATLGQCPNETPEA